MFKNLSTKTKLALFPAIFIIATVITAIIYSSSISFVQDRIKISSQTTLLIDELLKARITIYQFMLIPTPSAKEAIDKQWTKLIDETLTLKELFVSKENKDLCDVVVKDIKDYLAGVECDGAAYHSARTARERDRLRQEVLENMGWRIYRIWSTDWIKDPRTEGEALITAINDAIANYGDASNIELAADFPEEKPDADAFVSVNKKEMSAAEQVNPYAFAAAVTTDFNALPRNASGYLDIADCILACVSNEFPMHYELLCQRLAPLYGNEKATVKVRREVDYGINRLRGKIDRKGDFFYPAGWKNITVRVPNSRKIGHISVEELAEAMNTILQTTVGNTREGLFVETTRVYGWQRMTQGIGASMSAACDLLIQGGKAQELDGKIVPKQD